MKRITSTIALWLLIALVNNVLAQPKDFFARNQNYYNLFSNDEKTKLDNAFNTKNIKSKDDAKLLKYTTKADKFYKLSTLPLSEKKIRRYKRKTYKYDLKAAKIKLPIITQYIEANKTIKAIYSQKINNTQNTDTCVLNAINRLMAPYQDTAQSYKSISTNDLVQKVNNLENAYYYDNFVILYMEYQLATIAGDTIIYKPFKDKYCRPKPVVKVPEKPKYDFTKDTNLFVTKESRLDMIIKYTPSEQFTISQHPINGDIANNLLLEAQKLNDSITFLRKKADDTFDPFQKSIYVKNSNVLIKEQNKQICEAFSKYYLTNRNYFYSREAHTQDFFDIDSVKFKEHRLQKNLAYSQAYFTEARKIFDDASKDTLYIDCKKIQLANKLIITALKYQENFFLAFLGLDTNAIQCSYKVDYKPFLIKFDQPQKQQTTKDTTKVAKKQDKKDVQKKTKTTSSAKTVVVGLYEYNFQNPKPVLSPLTNGTVYRVYVGQTKYILPVNELKDFGTIYYETFANTELKYFYVGNFSSKEQATETFNQLKTRGYPVKIVKFVDNRRTDVEYRPTALNTAPTPVTQPKTTTAIDVKTTKNLIYLIQIGTYSSQKTNKDFKNISNLYFQQLSDGRFQYYTDPSYTLADAQKKLQNYKNKGYNDAIIVAFNNGSLINNDDAQKLEQTVNKSQIVYFRVQVGAFSSKLTDEQLNQKYDKLKSLGINNFNKKGLIVYTVGNTTSYDEAQNLLQKVKSLGYNDSFIIAIKNNTQIPLDKAF